MRLLNLKILSGTYDKKQSSILRCASTHVNVYACFCIIRVNVDLRQCTLIFVDARGIHVNARRCTANDVDLHERVSTHLRCYDFGWVEIFDASIRVK
uniref:Uncharacterized protein n=1 Tax=Romanomermis culicivorax TaxID=13658 RepID=A0A915IN26_ROMCU